MVTSNIQKMNKAVPQQNFCNDHMQTGLRESSQTKTRKDQLQQT